MLQQTTIHTLGPVGTNCEKAGHLWLKMHHLDGLVLLYPTLEEALIEVKKDKNSLLLGCAVYPYLHNIVFENISDIEIKGSFVMPTWNMVLATLPGTNIPGKDDAIATHPAPAHLASKISENIQLVDSNAQAALNCANREVSACITTIKAAKNNNLIITKDFGEVPMCFTIHGHKI